MVDIVSGRAPVKAPSSRNARSLSRLSLASREATARFAHWHSKSTREGGECRRLGTVAITRRGSRQPIGNLVHVDEFASHGSAEPPPAVIACSSGITFTLARLRCCRIAAVATAAAAAVVAD